MRVAQRVNSRTNFYTQRERRFFAMECAWSSPRIWGFTFSSNSFTPAHKTPLQTDRLHRWHTAKWLKTATGFRLALTIWLAIPTHRNASAPGLEFVWHKQEIFPMLRLSDLRYCHSGRGT